MALTDKYKQLSDAANAAGIAISVASLNMLIHACRFANCADCVSPKITNKPMATLSAKDGLITTRLIRDTSRSAKSTSDVLRTGASASVLVFLLCACGVDITHSPRCRRHGQLLQ